MGLNEIRALDDLESTYTKLSKEYESLVNAKEKTLIGEVSETFSEYFSKAKFKIEKHSDHIKAYYGSSSVVLDFSNPYGFMGCNIRMEMIISLTSVKPQRYILVLNSIEREKVDTSHESCSQIDAIKNKIRIIEGKLSQGVPPYQLYAKPENSKDVVKPYKSLNSLLDEITN